MADDATSAPPARAGGSGDGTPRYRRLSPERRLLALRLVKDGWPVARVATELGCNVTTVYRALRKPSKDEIADVAASYALSVALPSIITAAKVAGRKGYPQAGLALLEVGNLYAPKAAGGVNVTVGIQTGLIAALPGLPAPKPPEQNGGIALFRPDGQPAWEPPPTALAPAQEPVYVSRPVEDPTPPQQS